MFPASRSIVSCVVRDFLRLTAISGLSAVCAVSQAGTDVPMGSNSWFIGLGGGVSGIYLPRDTVINNGVNLPPPNHHDTATMNNPSASNVQLEAGYRWHRAIPYFPYAQWALQYRHYANVKISGTLNKFSSPGFDNYHYQLKYEADLFTIAGKVDLFQCKRVLPYLSAGIGAVINHVNSYSETALLNVTPRTSPDFQGNVNTKLALTLGAGLDYLMTENTWLTLGYEHVFQGNTKSGPGVDSWSSTAFNIGNTKMDTLFISLSANIPAALKG